MNARKVKGAQEQKRQTITVSSNLGYFWDLVETVSTIFLQQPLNQYCGRTMF
jgi:hypothetical protein